MKIKFSNFILLIPLTLLIILIGVFFYNSRTLSSVAQKSVQTATNLENELPLNIPLEQTKVLRQQMLNDLQSRNIPLLELYKKYIDQIGANGLISIIHEFYPTCHNQGHDLGKVIYDKTDNIGGAIRACQDACYSGCMHGIMMEVFTDSLSENFDQTKKSLSLDLHVNLEGIKTKIPTICNNPEILATHKKGDCIHGVGHALMYLSNYDIPIAMSSCNLFESEPESYYCATGAYMEYFANQPNKTITNKSLLSPCDQNLYSAACFRYHIKINSTEVSQKNIQQLSNDCMKLSESYRLGCFHGLGHGYLGYMVTGKTSVKDVCQYGTKDDQYMCIEGAIERMAKYFPEEAKAQCANLSGWKNDLCLEASNNKMYNLTKPFDLYL